MLVLHPAVLADADTLAVLAQLFEASLLAFAGLQALRRSLVRRRHGAMALGVFLLLFGAVLRLSENDAAKRGAGGEANQANHYLLGTASVRR